MTSPREDDWDAAIAGLGAALADEFTARVRAEGETRLRAALAGCRDPKTAALLRVLQLAHTWNVPPDPGGADLVIELPAAAQAILDAIGNLEEDR